MPNKTARQSGRRTLQGVLAGAALMAGWMVGPVSFAQAASAPALNLASTLFSDGTPQFVWPAEPGVGEPFLLRFRAGKGLVKSAVLQFAGVSYSMRKVSSDAWFDVYAAVVPGQQTSQGYYFQITPVHGRTTYLSAGGADTFQPETSEEFTLVPGFHTPAWAKGAVFYQIFPDRFYNGDPSNDVVTREYMYDGYPAIRVGQWSKVPDPTAYASGGNRTREFYGGDLQGIIDKLSYLKNLGIQALYLTPVFVSPSNHKYDTQDYSHVDPHLGVIVHDGGSLVDPSLGAAANAHASKYILRTEAPANLQASDALLARLIAKAHAMGMHVVLDGVFNHSGSFNKWFDQQHNYPNTPPTGPGADESSRSPFHDFYQFNGGTWPNNTQYDAWNGISTLPKLNYEGSPQLVKTIYAIAQKWVSPPYRADGWRLDSAGDLGYSQAYNLHFWDGFRTAVKRANPNALILAEYYNDPGPYLDGKGWDSVQNYNGFLTPVSSLLTGMEVHSGQTVSDALGNVSAFWSTMNTEMSLFPYPSLYTSMNALDNHDISRFLTRTNGQVGGDDMGSAPSQASQGIRPSVLEQGVMLDMTWPGDPTIYYGDEAGLTGWTDPDSRRTFPWGHENARLEAFYHNIIRVHNSVSSFRTGSLISFASGPNVLAYGRFDASSAAVTLINVSSRDLQVTIPAWKLDTPDGTRWAVRAAAGRRGQTATAAVVQSGGMIRVIVPGTGGLVLTSQR